MQVLLIDSLTSDMCYFRIPWTKTVWFLEITRNCMTCLWKRKQIFLYLMFWLFWISLSLN